MRRATGTIGTSGIPEPREIGEHKVSGRTTPTPIQCTDSATTVKRSDTMGRNGKRGRRSAPVLTTSTATESGELGAPAARADARGRGDYT